MITSLIRSKQPVHSAWNQERLDRKCAIALGQAIDTSTWSCYSSALNSYLDFIKNHNFPVEPTPNTLSYFTFYMSYYIKPSSANSYLSGICQKLEPFFPDVHQHHKSLLIHHTLKGCKQLHVSPTKRKRALTRDDLLLVIQHYQSSYLHDDLLFVTQLLTGFFALLQLGELTSPDDTRLCNPSKVVKRLSLSINDNSFLFFLPSHKGDKFFEGNTIVLMKSPYPNIPVFQHFQTYLLSCDHLFPFSSPLWLTSNGSVPTRSFFLQHLHFFFGDSLGGQSMCARGATNLALCGTPPSLIQPVGRWTSDSFHIYVHKHPILIQALLHSSSLSP